MCVYVIKKGQARVHGVYGENDDFAKESFTPLADSRVLGRNEISLTPSHSLSRRVIVLRVGMAVLRYAFDRKEKL